MSRKRPPSSSPPPSTPTTASAPPTRSAPITDRASTFIALFSPTTPPRTLQADPALASATHRILAWRVPSAQRTLGQSPRRIYDAGHDDDGERFAGKKLEALLESMRVEGAVVVGRWYGGVLLGPVRFAHIEGVAREAIRLWSGSGSGSAGAGVDGDESSAKRVKMDEEAARDKLAEVLRKRDRSIEALRGMLAEKTAAVVGAKDGDGAREPVLKKPPLDYSAMPLAAVRRLEKARDATIGWLLKEIEKVEKSVGVDEDVHGDGEKDGESGSKVVDETDGISDGEMFTVA